MDLTGKTIVITGAASGIGKATAFACARAGAQVTLTDFDAAKLAATTKELAEANPEAATLEVMADIRDSGQVGELFDQTAARFGQIDGIFANAGITGERKSITDLDF